MKAIYTYPTRITHREFLGRCGEKMCKKEPTTYTLIVGIENLPVDFYIPLCDEHAEALRDTMREIGDDLELKPQKLDWDVAKKHLDEMKGQYAELMNVPGVDPSFALGGITQTEMRFDKGERTRLLFDAMMEIE